MVLIAFNSTVQAQQTFPVKGQRVNTRVSRPCSLALISQLCRCDVKAAISDA